jgi:ankyrin repeat protein
VIARSHGFASWPKFAEHLEALARSSPVSRFEAAADAVVSGDTAALERLLREDPELIRARSTREHSATLLHYVSANGVEDYRQKTPANIVAITEMLLNAGAEVEATANVYGGGYTALGLAATSIHPERAGLQEALLQKLLDHGADLGKSIVTACLANGRAKAAEFLASRGARLSFVEAAGLGRLDIVKSLLPDTPSDQLKSGFLYSCQYGRNDVVEFLLERGVDSAMQDANGQSALHWAAIGKQLETVKLLLRRNVQLEATNVYGGTVLGQTLWSAEHDADPEMYIPILEELMAAEAEKPEGYALGNPIMKAWAVRHFFGGS